MTYADSFEMKMFVVIFQIWIFCSRILKFKPVYTELKSITTYGDFLQVECKRGI